MFKKSCRQGIDGGAFSSVLARESITGPEWLVETSCYQAEYTVYIRSIMVALTMSSSGGQLIEAVRIIPSAAQLASESEFWLVCRGVTSEYSICYAFYCSSRLSIYLCTYAYC